MDAHESSEQPRPLGLASTEGLGLEPERAAFEQAMAAEGYELNPGRYRDGTYRAPYYAAGWAMWQRARVAERERWQIEDGHGDRIDALLLKAKDMLARSERPKDCGATYAVPAAEWLALQEEVMHRLREHAREACGA